MSNRPEKQKYTKIYLTIPEQLECLKGRGLVLNDGVESILTQVSYYRLSGYWYPYRRWDRQNKTYLDDFVPGASFKEVFELYMFDKSLKLQLSDFIERLEISLRSLVVQVLGPKGQQAHRNYKNYNKTFTSRSDGESQFDILCKMLDDKERKSKDDFVRHFNKKYHAPLPLWSASELWDFGNLSRIISGLNSKSQRKISLSFGIENQQAFILWIRAIQSVRNISAHHGRLWNRRMWPQPSAQNLVNADQLVHLKENKKYTQRLYGTIAICQYFDSKLMQEPRWGKGIVELINDYFPQSDVVSIEQMGFPKNWLELDLWKDCV